MRRLLFAILLGLAAPAAANAAPESTHADCFNSAQWHGWSAPGNSDYLLLRVNMHDIYRVQLTPGIHVRRDPDRFLINRSDTNWVCSPLDLNLSVSDHTGFREPLIARGIRKLTPAEVAEIPRHDLPG